MSRQTDAPRLSATRPLGYAARMSRLIRCVVISLVWLAAATAHAQSGEARAHFDRATSAFALGRFDDAAHEYEKAFDLKPDPALLYNAAQAHRKAGNKHRALHCG